MHALPLGNRTCEGKSRSVDVCLSSWITLYMHTLIGYRVWRLDCSSSASAYHNTAIRYEQRLEMARGPAKGGG